MPTWYATRVIAQQKSFSEGETVTADIDEYQEPMVCVSLDSLNGMGGDVSTIAFQGDAGTYTVSEKYLSNTGSYTVKIPQSNYVEFTSANGATYSAEVRSNGY